MVTKICKVCNSSFNVKNYRKETAIFCSHICQGKFVSQNRKPRGKDIIYFIKRKPISDETKLKISLANKGKKKPSTSITNRKRIGIMHPFFNRGNPKISGENNYRWKGGITPLIMKIRMGMDIKRWRELVFKRDNFTCKLCNHRGGDLEAHHIKKFSTFPKDRFITNNGITLCKKCHNITIGREEKFEQMFGIILRLTNELYSP